MGIVQGSLNKWYRKKRHRKKWHRKKRHKEKMAQEKNGTKCMIGKNGTILFLFKTEINKFFKLYILLTKKMEKGRQKNKRSP